MNSKQKNDILRTLAELLMKNKKPIIQANQQDLALCSLADKVVYDRLIIDDKKIEDMVASIEKIIALADPEGKILFSHKHENGLKIENRSVPFGTVLIIYESRPDVTIEATAIALKAGNKVILKGGKEAKNTNVYLVDLWNEALALNAQSVEWISYLDISRAETQILIQDNSKKIDLIIPRGGQALIDFVKKYSLVPVLVGGRGNNFLYIDEETDFVMAEKIIINGKQVLSACNSLDKVLINSKISGLDEKLKELVEELKNNSISLIGDDELCRLDSEIMSIENEATWGQEYLAAKILIAKVDDLDEAILKINTYSGGHSASIITNNLANAEKFLNQVDCAAVYHNASTRFTDGGQFGLGGEIAISTQKLHFRGPMGVDQLVTNKWFIYGDGQIRQ